jgi:hypothetical protein
MSIKLLEWSPVCAQNGQGRYHHVTAATPLGRFRITWNSWKERPQYDVNETPWGEDLHDGDWSLVAAKVACQAEFTKRVEQCLAPDERDQQIEALQAENAALRKELDDERKTANDFARQAAKWFEKHNELELQVAALKAQIEAAKNQEPFSDWPNYNSAAMGCGLEDRGITDRYEAMYHGWECAIECVSELGLYAAPLPPTLRELSDEEITEIDNNRTDSFDQVGFARAIIKAAREKQQ